MDNLMILAVLGGVVAAMAIGAFVGLIVLTLLTYVVSHVYPWLKRLAKLCAKPENLFSFLILGVALIVLVVILFVVVRNILVLLLILPPLVFFIPVDLGLIVWAVRLLKWIYARWKGWLVGIYVSLRLEIMKAKIKMDIQKETDWKIKWQDMKDKLSSDADRARTRISRRK